MNKEFVQKFQINELKIIDFQKWVLSLRPQQSTLGSMVISLKRDCKYLGELTKNETEELAEVCAKTEKLIKQCFNNDKINYLALMMVDEQVHFHVIPRYAKAREFAGVEFLDKNWPKQPDITQSYSDATTLDKIYNKLRSVNV
jgi:diadenosine tetraphosphate (Ap4A) HIT family hydrolase